MSFEEIDKGAEECAVGPRQMLRVQIRSLPKQVRPLAVRETIKAGIDIAAEMGCDLKTQLNMILQCLAECGYDVDAALANNNADNVYAK